MSRLKFLLMYLISVGVPLAALLGILHAGRNLHASLTLVPSLPPNSAPVATPATPDLVKLILQIAVIIAASRAVASLFEKMRQPKVIGEMVAGIMLGPSLLGWVAPQFSAALFPASSLGYLNAMSQVGIIIYMFLVGLAVNPKDLREHGHTAVLTSHASIIAPFLLGSALAYYLYPRLSYTNVTFTGFALFMGAAMSITAFPVLARILTDRGILQTKLGTLAITCAAVDDVTGWCILAYIVFTIRSHEASHLPLWMTIAGLAAFVATMVYMVKPLLRVYEKTYERLGRLNDSAVAVLLIVVLISSVTTEKLGLHLLFGSFLAGVVMPKKSEFVRHLLDKFETTTLVLLLPLFFAFTGLRTSIQVIQGPGMWVFLVLILAVAITGKIGGSMIAARVSGTSWSEAAGIGILMNTRGLMELVILNIGLDIGVISPALFSMMVIMAVTTTFMTAPLLELVYPPHVRREVPVGVSVGAAANS